MDLEIFVSRLQGNSNAKQEANPQTKEADASETNPQEIPPEDRRNKRTIREMAKDTNETAEKAF